MKWNENKFRGYNSIWVLEDYPFFSACFEGNKIGGYELGYMFKYPRQRFTDLDQAKSYIIDHIYKIISKIDINNIKSIDEFNLHPLIRITYDTWCGNTGDGKYIGNGLYQNYHWLEGRHLHTTSTSHNYAIRYTREVPEDFVRSQGVKIIKRHIRRFIREYNQQHEQI